MVEYGGAAHRIVSVIFAEAIIGERTAVDHHTFSCENCKGLARRQFLSRKDDIS